MDSIRRKMLIFYLIRTSFGRSSFYIIHKKFRALKNDLCLSSGSLPELKIRWIFWNLSFWWSDIFRLRNGRIKCILFAFGNSSYRVFLSSFKKICYWSIYYLFHLIGLIRTQIFEIFSFYAFSVHIVVFLHKIIKETKSKVSLVVYLSSCWASTTE